MKKNKKKKLDIIGAEYEPDQKITEAGLGKNSYNVIKTSMRNNVDLTAIADNKANILLTLSSLLFTILIPVVLGSLEIIMDEYLYIPLLILAATCIVSIVMAALVTRPMKLSGQAFSVSGTQQFSPFFFGNYYKMTEASYKDYVASQLENPGMMKEYILSDMFHIGRGLGIKYSRIRKCYTVFIAGLLLAVASAILVVAFL